MYTGEDYVVIGKILNTIPQYPARLVKSSLFRHVFITGSTGSGKSYTASIISHRVSHSLGVTTVILDWHGEYPSLIPSGISIDPFETPIHLFTEDPEELGIISSVLELTPSQEYILEKVIKRIDLEKIRDIDVFIDLVENYPDESSWIRESKLALHRRLSILARGRYSQLFKIQGSSFNTLKNIIEQGLIIVLLDRIQDTAIRRLYSAFFIKRLVDVNVTTGKPILIILEEAQNYLSRQKSIRTMSEILREMRKFNVGLVVISQSIQQLVEDAAVNTNTKIIHAVKARQDLDIVEKSLYLDQGLMTILPYLEPGEAIYATPILKKPVLVKIE